MLDVKVTEFPEQKVVGPPVEIATAEPVSLISSIRTEAVPDFTHLILRPFIEAGAGNVIIGLKYQAIAAFEASLKV